MKRFFAIIRILSLDVVLGACVGSMFIAKYLQVELPMIHLIALGLSVWIIYTADHLADAYQVKHQAHSRRHLFHQQNFRIMLVLFVMAILTGLIIIFYLPSHLILWGLCVVFFVAIYFLVLKTLPFHKNYYKEFSTALLYTTGIFLSPLSLYHHGISLDIILTFIQFVLIAFANLIIFAWYETELDKQDGHLSFVLLYGESRSKRLVYGCLLIASAISLYGIFTRFHNRSFLLLELVLLLMGVALVLILMLPGFFGKNERYRILGDSIFLFPLLTMIL